MQQVRIYGHQQQVDVGPPLLIRPGLKFHPAQVEGTPSEVDVSCKWEAKSLRSLLLVSVMYVAVSRRWCQPRRCWRTHGGRQMRPRQWRVGSIIHSSP